MASSTRPTPSATPMLGVAGWSNAGKTTLIEKLTQLQAQLRAHAPLIVAYSGGVDSACLLAEAHETLGAQFHQG